MSLRLLILATLLIAAGADARVDAAPDRKFPYEAVIDVDDTYVRSGNGKNFYPTGRLKKGDRVTVHRHDPGGWYMIAPPKGSFSWIPAQYVQKAAADRGVVNANNVIVRIGSFESDDRDFWQQKLSSGDEVRILGEKMLPADKGPPQPWYKITPPRNEWRWIEGRSVVPLDKPLPSSPAAGDDPFDQTLAANRKTKPASAKAADLVQNSNPPGVKPVATDKYDQAATANKSDRLVERPIVRREGKGVGKEGDAVHQTGPDRSRLEAERAELDRLDARLKAIVDQEISIWDFAQIEHDYLKLRGLVSQLNFEKIIDNRLASIANYKQLRADHEEFLRLANETARRDAELLDQQRRLDAQLASRQGVRIQFDGAGVVQRAATANRGGLRHVLLAPNGRVLAYLVPAPGIDLDAWVGRAAGVNGPRAYRPELHSDLITVNRVSPVRLAP